MSRFYTQAAQAHSPEQVQGCLGRCFGTPPAYIRGAYRGGLRGVHLKPPETKLSFRVCMGRGLWHRYGEGGMEGEGSLGSAISRGGSRRMASGGISREGVCLSVCFWLPEELPPPPQVSLRQPSGPSSLQLLPTSPRQKGWRGLGWDLLGRWGWELWGETDTLEASSHPEQDSRSQAFCTSTSAQGRTHASVTGVTAPSHGAAAWLGKGWVRGL